MNLTTKKLFMNFFYNKNQKIILIFQIKNFSKISKKSLTKDKLSYTNRLIEDEMKSFILNKDTIEDIYEKSSFSNKLFSIIRSPIYIGLYSMILAPAFSKAYIIVSICSLNYLIILSLLEFSIFISIGLSTTEENNMNNKIIKKSLLPLIFVFFSLLYLLIYLNYSEKYKCFPLLLLNIYFYIKYSKYVNYGYINKIFAITRMRTVSGNMVFILFFYLLNELKSNVVK